MADGIHCNRQRRTVCLCLLYTSMDAFAVSVCKGLSLGETKLKHSVTAGLYFGGFQAIMPLIGYMLGIRFQHMIQRVDHWIEFVLLLIIGINMIREAKEQEECSSSMKPKDRCV